MAGFLIPFGQALGELGAGQVKGQDVREDLRWRKLTNDLLQQRLQYGGIDPKLYLKEYMKQATTRQTNAEIGHQWAIMSEQLKAQGQPQQAQAYANGSRELLGEDGMGSLQNPTQVALNAGIRQQDITYWDKWARFQQIMNPPVRPYVAMGPDGQPIVGGIQQPLDLSGGRNVGTVGLPAIGGPSLNMPGVSGTPGLPGATLPEMPPPSSLLPSGAPGNAPAYGGSPAAEGYSPTEQDIIARARASLRAKGYPDKEIEAVISALAGTPGVPASTPARAAAPATVPTAPAVPAPAAPAPGGLGATGVAGPGIAPTPVRVPDPPAPALWRSAKAPQPIPRAWGGTDKPLNAYLRPRLDNMSFSALGSLNTVLRQTEMLYRVLHAVPTNLKRGTPGALWDWLKLKAHWSSGATADAVMSQVGATTASLISGFQAAGKTRAFAAIKMVDDHYPKLGDSYELMIHKCQQLMRPDGYLSFARNSILYGPTAAAAMAPINEPQVAPPGSAYDATQHWTFPSGNKGMMLDGLPYRQDTDGYWVEIR